MLSLLLAALTWRMVERPLARWRLRPVAAGLAAAMLAAVGLSSATYATAPAESNVVSDAACTSRYPFRPDGLWFCRLSKDAAPTVLLLGDSHANHLHEGVASRLSGGRGPDHRRLHADDRPGLSRERADAKDACVNDNFKVQSEYLRRHVTGAPTLRWVIVSAMWRTFDEAGREIDYWSGKPVSTFEPVIGSALDSYVAALERQIEQLGPVPVTIVLDTPRRGLAVDLQRQRQAPFDRAVAVMAQRHANVRVFDPMPVLCTGPWCAWHLLRDANHLSRLGSVTVARAMAASPPGRSRRRDGEARAAQSTLPDAERFSSCAERRCCAGSRPSGSSARRSSSTGSAPARPPGRACTGCRRSTRHAGPGRRPGAPWRIGPAAAAKGRWRASARSAWPSRLNSWRSALPRSA